MKKDFNCYFGGCPECGGTHGFANIGPDHWFTCDDHKTKWWTGSNLFSGWREQDEETWRENEERLVGYTKVRPREVYINDMDVFDSMRRLINRGVNLDDRAAVEAELLGCYSEDPTTFKRFVDWCIKSARVNIAERGTGPWQHGEEGFVPRQDA